MKTIYPFMGLALCSVAAQAQEKPNFLIIQCDHLTQRVVGAYGQTQGCTLPIDEVASRGVIFSNAYVGCPLSQPLTRCFMEWHDASSNQCTFQLQRTYQPTYSRKCTDIRKSFSENGYEAVHFGKRMTWVH